MGIKNLMKYIKTHNSNAIVRKGINNLENKVICIDTPCILYKYKFSNHTSVKNGWVNNLIYFILKTIENNIDCVFILEGTAPKEKDVTKHNRYKARENVLKRSKFLNDLLENYRLTKTVSPDLEFEWKKLNLGDQFDEQAFENLLKKRKMYSEFVTKDDNAMFLEIVKAFNIHVVQSLNEAETTCAYLYSKKKCDYIYSQDSDVIAYYDTDGLVTDIDFKNNTFSYIDKNILLNNLDFTRDEFLDFCILCGTDYNSAIPKIGIMTSYKYIKENSNFFTKLNQSCLDRLNVNWIREKFKLKEFENEEGIFEDFIVKWPKCNQFELYRILEHYNIVLTNTVEKMLLDFNESNKTDDDDLDCFD